MKPRLRWLAIAALLAGGGAFAAQRLGGGASQGAPSIEPAPAIARVTVPAVPARTIADRGVADREVVIEGSGFFGTSMGPFVRFDGRDAVAVMMDPNDLARRLIAYAPPELKGRVEIVVENPDGQSVRAFAQF